MEFGLNLRSQIFELYKAHKVPEWTVFLYGNPKTAKRNKYSRDGYMLEITKGPCSYTLYDKGRQFNLSEEVLRSECRCKRERLQRLGLNNFLDLLNPDIHSQYFEYYLEKFDSLIIHQPEVLDHPALSSADRQFVLEHSSMLQWTEIRKTSNYKFHQDAKKMNSVISKHAPLNLRDEILKLMRANY